MHLKRHIGALGLSLLLGSALFAQAAPKPPQLAAARSVFISNDTGAYGTQSDVAYNQFYAAIQKLDRFTIVVDPLQADLILEVGTGEIHNHPIPLAFYETLRVLDPKSKVVLWSVSESSPGQGSQALIDKNALAALDRLAADLQRVCTPSATH